MYEFHPYFTNDGSVGLFSPKFNDIYHSATGALTEACEKFVQPIDFDKLMQKEQINILDICFGLGYNTKSFLDNFLKNSTYTNRCTETIYTNNIKQENKLIYNDKIYTDNTKENSCKFSSINEASNNIEPIHTDKVLPKVFIKALDNDEILAYLSPFIKTGEKITQKQKLDFDYKKIEKYLQPERKTKPSKIDELINYILFVNLLQTAPDFIDNKEIASILSDKRYKKFFESKIRHLYEFYQNSEGKHTQRHAKGLFLHNIYYRYISNSYKKRLKSTKIQNINFELEINDARQSIINDKNQYDLIFLDAFTPSKCPCLWSYEFFQKLYEHLKPDGMILTYSTSASIRAAMIEAGFYIGENVLNNKSIGTIAAKDKSLIKHQLSKYDLGLLKTTAGIFYRDENLTGLNEAISAARNLELKNSNRISSSHYKKMCNC